MACVFFVLFPQNGASGTPSDKKTKNRPCNSLIARALQKGNFYAVKDLLLPSKRPAITGQKTCYYDVKDLPSECNAITRVASC